MSIHLTDDFLHEPGGMSLVEFSASALVLAVLLYGTLVFAGRRGGYIATMVGSIFAVAMGVIHALGGGVPNSRGFFFVWTLIALGVLGIFSFILSVDGLLSLRGAQRKP